MILELRCNYVIQKPTKHFIQDKIINNENALRHPDTNNTEYLSFSGTEENITNQALKQDILHTRQINTIKSIRRKLIQNKQIITKAD